ncbi:glycosyltransferase family 4 protein [Paenibacillus chitinolyticus]|uniref:glycosyltransferase family 4 protein n=1 Tax=Paenibacillus chitinolyticus TaxID=79263 RepID=UPI00366A236F
MRVALFTDTFLPDVNGVAKTLGRWVRYLESRGVVCRVFAPAAAEAGTSGIRSVERFYSIPFSLYPDCRMAIPNPLLVGRMLKEFRPTLIHLATPFNLGLTGLHYGKKHRIPLVASYHTHFDQYLTHYRLQWMEPMLWKYLLWFHQNCVKVYVPSPSTGRILHTKGLTGIELWGRGIDTAEFRPHTDRRKVLNKHNLLPGKFVLLYVGRLAPEKGLDALVRAFASLPEAFRAKCALILAGDGPMRAELEKRLAPYPDVRFCGFVEGRELAELYAAADVFVFPSASETFGNVVLEAMASGTAVVGVNAGGVADNVRHGYTGLLCPPDDASALAAAVQRLYEAPELRRKLALEGRSHALTRSWDSIFATLYESYREVAGDAGGGARRAAGIVK